MLGTGLLIASLLSACGGAGQSPDVISASITSPPDSLDPAFAFSLPALEAMWQVYTPLVTYRHAAGSAGTELIPGLARALPEISPDRRTYRLRLRSGLHYSDGTPVKASDFEHTIARVLALNSPGAPYFSDVVGAEEFAKHHDSSAGIRGIATNDGSGEITIRLKEPESTFSNVLATDFAGLVPGDTPMSQQATPPPGVGPFEISHVSASEHAFNLVKNDRFDVPGLPKAGVDEIRISANPDIETQAEDVIRNRVDLMQDPPPPDLAPEIRSKYADRYREHVVAATAYFFLNQKIPPFNRTAVRRAVNIAISRKALARIYGGLMEPSCNFLPPQIPGYRAIEPCPYGDPNGPGSLAEAKRMVDAAGVKGQRVDVWGPSEGPDQKAAIYLSGVLGQIGFESSPKLVPFASYSALIGNARTRAQAGILEWLQDYPHPADFLGLFNGNAIRPIGNLNVGNVDDPWLTAQIERLKKSPSIDESAWAAVDRRLIDEADVAVVGHPMRTSFVSDRIDTGQCLTFSPVFQVDYSKLCLK